MTDEQVLNQVQNHWKLSRGFYTALDLPKMLNGYRALKKSGRTDNDVVIYWSSPTVGMSRIDAATFVAAMKMINNGQSIQDPNEKPTWSEVYNESGLPGSKKNPFPWVKLTAVAAVGLFVVWGLPNLVKATRDSGHHKKVPPEP